MTAELGDNPFPASLEVRLQDRADASGAASAAAARGDPAGRGRRALRPRLAGEGRAGPRRAAARGRGAGAADGRGRGGHRGQRGPARAARATGRDRDHAARRAPRSPSSAGRSSPRACCRAGSAPWPRWSPCSSATELAWRSWGLHLTPALEGMAPRFLPVSLSARWWPAGCWSAAWGASSPPGGSGRETARGLAVDSRGRP